MNTLKRLARSLAQIALKFSYLLRAVTQAAVMGIIEIATSERGRRLLAVLSLAALVAFALTAAPIKVVEPGAVAVRVNRLTGQANLVEPGWVLVLPGVHALRAYPAGDRVYHPDRGAHARGEAPFQTVEGLSIGVEITVRYALDPRNSRLIAAGLPDDLGPRVIEPVIDAVFHSVLAAHTVREIYATGRHEIEAAVQKELVPILEPDGVLLRNVFIGNVDLPAEYRAGLDALLAEELASQRMKYTLELKEKAVKESELEALARKAQEETEAEARAQQEIIAARGRAEAMKHVLPLKEKEVEQRRLEAEASRVTRLRLAETEAEARRIEASGEADYRKKVAESDAYRIEVLGKASSEQLARDSAVIAQNPLMIQKTLAEKLSDKIQVVIAPPSAGFFAANLLGKPAKAGRPGGAKGQQARGAAPGAEPALEDGSVDEGGED